MYIPETLQQCREHYVPPIKEHINCPTFGRKYLSNEINCTWCMEMEPYQWHMCQDASWLRSLMGWSGYFEEDGINFIEWYKQRHPLGNERLGLPEYAR